MVQDSDQADLQTDAYPMERSKAPSKSGVDINKNQKKTLGISAAALLLGGAAWAVKQQIDSKIPGTAVSGQDGSNTPTIQLPRELDVAGKVTDDMSFDQAFTTARSEVGMVGVFGWHGHWYNTFLKEEWIELSIQQRLDFTEMVTHEHLPVKPYEQTVTRSSETAQKTPEIPAETDPTVIEGHLNGQRVMGLDFDQDGVIDTLVLEGQDGYNYRVVDAGGDQGLDTLYVYDTLDGELRMVEKMEHPFVLTNDQFSQGLEESMSKDVVDSILEPDDSALANPESTPTGDTDVDTEPDDDTIYLTDVHGDDDDTYINNGDVRDMDE